MAIACLILLQQKPSTIDDMAGRRIIKYFFGKCLFFRVYLKFTDRFFKQSGFFSHHGSYLLLRAKSLKDNLERKYEGYPIISDRLSRLPAKVLRLVRAVEIEVCENWIGGKRPVNRNPEYENVDSQVNLVKIGDLSCIIL